MRRRQRTDYTCNVNPDRPAVKGPQTTPATAPDQAPRVLTVEGGALAVTDSGRGVPFLLLHGFPLASDIFDPLRPGVERVARQITPDLPGFGRSPAASAGTMESLARRMLVLLDTLGVERAVLGGHSMGGYIALRMAALAPERVLGLVLIATRAAPDGDAGAESRRRAIAVIEAGGKGEFLDGFVPRLLGASTRQRAPRLLAELRGLADEVAPETLAACQRGMLQRPDSRPVLAALAVPTLVVAGAEDELIPREESDEMVDLAGGAELVLIPRSGHTPSVERPIAAADAIAAFLARHFPGTPDVAAESGAAAGED